MTRFRALWPVLLLLLLPGMALAAGMRTFDEGIEYIPLKPPVPTSDPRRIEVVELFWYGCPHCYRFEPKFRKWIKERKPDNVNIVLIPAITGPGWVPAAKAFYTAELLGVLDRSHQALFDAIHVERKRFRNGTDFARFFTRFGISEEKFLETYSSFAVDLKVRRAADLTRRYGVDGVPSVVVNGKYRTSGPLVNGDEGMLDALDYLIALEAGKLGK
ncbi:MAG TPA: thiol:disulfide interchange protein DsbA/DsbL [Gammaproteobacteria bacterium]|nr:thiol:disulfide interchange protein DsbA/DsbL [Gammaproteobacteria bacterium]